METLRIQFLLLQLNKNLFQKTFNPLILNYDFSYNQMELFDFNFAELKSFLSIIKGFSPLKFIF